jgi:hypothetical protein
VTPSMFVFHRRTERKVLKLARLLATLDDHARTVRPVPRRAGRMSVSA